MIEIIKVEDFDVTLLKDFSIITKSGNRGGVKQVYFSDFFTFDIETTNLSNIEQSFMYIWQLAISDDIVIIGRNWRDFLKLLRKIRTYLKKISPARYYDKSRCVIFIHNLSFEFQYLKGVYQFKNDNIFALNTRKVAKCLMYDFFEFRCSYIHSNLSLDKYLKKMGVKNQKLSGDKFDYTKIRTPQSALTPYELNYCVNDVLGLHQAINIDMAMSGDDLYSFPLTSTGYVRRDIKNELRKLPKDAITQLLPSDEVYRLLRLAFRGGDTHASRFYANRILENVKSADRSSSYSDVIVNYKYPIRPFKKTNIKSVERYEELKRKGKAVVMIADFFNIKVKKYEPFPYIPIAKILKMIKNDDDFLNDNGRLISANRIRVAITDVDFEIIKKSYDFEKIKIKTAYISTYGALPEVYTNLVKKYYKLKTNLKADTTAEGQYFYAKSKEKLNSLYGIMAQDPARNDILFEDNILIEKINNIPTEKALLPYQWGVWTTAWARYALREGIDCVENPVYCDTDSVKYLGDADFSKLNKRYTDMSKKNNASAIDGKAVEHFMGVFEKDGNYKFFKTLGAKKYAYVENDDSLHITVAGVPKIKGAEQLKSIENFCEGFLFTNGCTLVKHNDNVNQYVKIKGEKIKITDNTYIGQGSYHLGLTIDYLKVLQAVEKELFNMKEVEKNELI